MTEARDGALAQGVTINGLVILSEIPLATNPMHTHPPGGLTHYYEKNVIGGPGAFVVEAESFEAFGQSADLQAHQGNRRGPAAHTRRHLVIPEFRVAKYPGPRTTCFNALGPGYSADAEFRDDIYSAGCSSSQTLSGIGRPANVSAPSGSSGVMPSLPSTIISWRTCWPECQVVRSRNSCSVTSP